MMKVFGKASDFYRLRVLKLNEDSELDLGWEDDILLRRPADKPMKTKIWYIVQAVCIDSEDSYVLKRFKSGDVAMRFKDRAEELLKELTKSEFEAKFPSLSGSNA